MQEKLTTRALLVDLTIRCWSARVTDRSASRELVREKRATSEAARVRKHLLAGADSELRAVAAAANSARVAHRSLTLPWGESARILPTELYFKYQETMSNERTRFSEALSRFVAAYDAALSRAAAHLGSLGNDEAPTSASVAARFGFEIVFLPLADAGDFRVSLTDAEREALTTQARAAVARRIGEATRELWSRLLETLERVAARLSDPDAVFRDSLIGNVKSAVELLPSLNIGSDASLDAALREVARRVASFHPQTLRDDARTRADVADAARDLAARFKGYAAAGGI